MRTKCYSQDGRLHAGAPCAVQALDGMDPNAPLPAEHTKQAGQHQVYVRLSAGLDVLALLHVEFRHRQNSEQGFYPWDKSSGHWISGISFLDSWRLYNQSQLPEAMKHDQYNAYYLLPFLFGIIGMFFHFKNKTTKRDLYWYVHYYRYRHYHISNQPSLAGPRGGLRFGRVHIYLLHLDRDGCARPFEQFRERLYQSTGGYNAGCCYRSLMLPYSWGLRISTTIAVFIIPAPGIMLPTS